MASPSSSPRIVSGPLADPRRYLLWGVLGVVLAAALAAIAARWYTLAEQSRQADRLDRLEQEHHTDASRLEALGQQLAVAQRAAQITEEANDRLRAEVERLQGEIAALKADNEFYQRLLGSSGQTEGLAVHELRLTPMPSSRVFRYRITLTQNLKKAKPVAGEYSMSVDGVRGDRALRLNGEELTLQSDEEEPRFEFKYFQQLSGTLVLPQDFVPNRLTVNLRPEGNGRKVVSRDFGWEEVLATTAEAATGSG